MTDEPPRGSEAILVVDDDALAREPIQRTLRSLGYFVLEANDGEHALHVLQAHHAPVHLVISDVMMPTMNGAELTGMLREWYPNLSILLMSGMGTDAFDASGLPQPPGTHFIAKPFRMEDLAARVRSVLDTDWGG